MRRRYTRDLDGVDVAVQQRTAEQMYNGLAGSVVARLREAHPEVGVNSVTDLVGQFRERISYFRQVSVILGTISLAVTVLLISTILTITVNERLGEIATLRALDVERGEPSLSALLDEWLVAPGDVVIVDLQGKKTTLSSDSPGARTATNV